MNDLGKEIRSSVGGQKNQNALFPALEFCETCNNISMDSQYLVPHLAAVFE